MNEELIDDFAFEAGCHRHKYWDPNHPDLEGFIISRAALDKFAELIVRECIEVVLSSDPSPKMIAHEPYRTIMNNIVEHFGVNE